MYRNSSTKIDLYNAVVNELMSGVLKTKNRYPKSCPLPLVLPVCMSFNCDLKYLTVQDSTQNLSCNSTRNRKTVLVNTNTNTL